jgi:aerobic carbon-monoxide dehydrogenase large subunit
MIVDRCTRRVEDARLLSGLGRFVDDVDLPGQLWMRVARSTEPHARLLAIDAEAARAMPGVVAVVTASDLHDVPPIPIRIHRLGVNGEPYLQPVLAEKRVRYVGEPIAVVLAEDPYAAEDAAEQLNVSYEPLGPQVDARAAASLMSLRDGVPNLVSTLEFTFGDVEAAFAGAAHIVEAEMEVGRHSGVPMETRGLIAQPQGDGSLTIWGATKVPHYNRRVLAQMLRMPPDRIRMLSGDAGGGFGVRGELYPEDVLVALLAFRMGRPVKWIEDRMEHLVAANQSRQQRHAVRAAFDADGHFRALHNEVWHDQGAYLRTHGVRVAEISLNLLPGPYRIPAYRAHVHVVTTNKTPAGTYRSPGHFETTFVRERLLDIAAARIGIDPLEIRRRNLIRPVDQPYDTGIDDGGQRLVIHEADIPELFEVAAARYGEWKLIPGRAGTVSGVGLAVFIEKSGRGPYETAVVAIDSAGQVSVASGATSFGQGVETVLAQICSTELGLSPGDVTVLGADTSVVVDGVGTWASRSTAVAGSATMLAARKMRERLRDLASEMMDVPNDQVHLAGGMVVAEDRAPVTFSEIVLNSDPSGLVAEARYEPGPMAHPYGIHLARVEVDQATGKVGVAAYLVAYEIGRAINPILVEGQLAGGVVQGIGGALLEEFVYSEDGQPLSTTFVDYRLPTSLEASPVDVILSERFPASGNLLGVMGAGEGGTTGVGAAVANAIADALERSDAFTRLPIRPEAVLDQVLHARRGPSRGSPNDGR